jgi:hypothetical protein
VTDWLKAHEFLAIWLEGIALVLIFVWDRLDSRKQHKETLSQLEALQNNAAAAKATAEVLMESQRPRIVAQAHGNPTQTLADPQAPRVELEVINKGPIPAIEYFYESWIEVLLIRSVPEYAACHQHPTASGNHAGRFS